MHKYAIFGLALGLVSTAYSQAIKVSGTVKDAANKPIANAIVELLRAKAKDTTGADGAFSLNVTANAVRRPGASLAGEISLQRGMLELATAEAVPIQVEIFDVKGNLVDRLAMEMAAAGTYRLDLAGRVRSQNLVIVVATVGRTSKSFHYLPTGFGAASGSFSPERSSLSAAPLAKVSAAVDTLQVSAVGFATKKVEVATADETLNVILEPSTDIWGGLKNPPGKSAGCGKPATITNGKKSITSGGREREYVIDIPAGYDPATPYRLMYVGHGIPGMASDVPGGGWWGFKSVAPVPAVWIAPGAVNGVRGAWSTADNRDHVLFDDITAAAKAGLCVDTTRIFAMGMSGGGMLTNSLTSDRQLKIRAGVAMGPTNFNIWIPNPPLKDPIAWMQTTGMSDNLTAWVASEAQKRGSKFIALEKAANNGCTPAEIPTWKSGPHVCYDFAGCKPGYPTKICTFNGGHVHFNTDPGSNVNWIAKEGWEFLMQF